MSILILKTKAEVGSTQIVDAGKKRSMIEADAIASNKLENTMIK